MSTADVYSFCGGVIAKKNGVIALHDTAFNKSIMGSSFGGLADLFDPRDGDCLCWRSREDMRKELKHMNALRDHFGDEIAWSVRHPVSAHPPVYVPGAPGASGDALGRAEGPR